MSDFFKTAKQSERDADNHPSFPKITLQDIIRDAKELTTAQKSRLCGLLSFRLHAKKRELLRSKIFNVPPSCWTKNV